MTRTSLATASATALLLFAVPASYAGTIFVSNEKDNTITVIDTRYAQDRQDHQDGAASRAASC